MPTNERIDRFRLRANSNYKLALTLLDSTQEKDKPATTQAITLLHDSIGLLESIAFDFGEEIITGSDYLLLAHINCGLARAYEKMSMGINPGDIRFRLEMITKYIDKAASKFVGEYSSIQKEYSAHASLSLLNTNPNISLDVEARDVLSLTT